MIYQPMNGEINNIVWPSSILTITNSGELYKYYDIKSEEVINLYDGTEVLLFTSYSFKYALIGWIR